MIRDTVIRPPRLAGETDTDIVKLRSYLHSLSEQIQNVFDSINDDPSSDAAVEELAQKVYDLERAFLKKSNRGDVNRQTAEINKTLTKIDGDVLVQAENIDLLAKEISAQADKIALQANDILALSAGVGENKAAIVLANGRIDANAAAIALKADQASLELANGRIDAQANTIALKADKIELEGYTTLTEFEALKGEVENLFTSDLIVHGGLSANTVVAGEGDFDNLGFGTISGQNPDAWVTGIVDEAGYATQAWVKNSGYITNGALAGYATQSWVNAKGYVTQDWVSKQGYLVSSDYFDLQAWVNDKNYMPKSGLTTKTVTVCTGTNTTKATTPPFFNANGTQVSSGVSYVSNVTYNTTDLTYLVYA